MENDKQKVKAVYRDAEISTAFAVQPDKTRKWMYCVMSSLKFLASRGKGQRVQNVSSWRFTEAEAWADAVSRVAAAPEAKGIQNER